MIGHFHRLDVMMKMILTLLLLSILAILPQQVNGWGSLGHIMVGNIAWKMLSNRTQTIIEEILVRGNSTTSSIKSFNQHQHHPQHHHRNHSCIDCSPMGLCANWADEIKHFKQYSWSAHLHYVNIRDDIIDGGCPVVAAAAAISKNNSNHHYDLCSFNYSRDCVNDECASGAIVNYTERIRTQYYLEESPNTNTNSASNINNNNNNNHKMVRESLMFLIHLIGDIHQPLHSSRATDRGGNTIQVHFHTTTAAAGTTTTARDINNNNEAAAASVTASSFHLRNRLHRTITRRTTSTSSTSSPNNANSLRRSQSSRSRNRHYYNNLHSVWDDGIIERTLEDNYNDTRQQMELDLYNYILEQPGKTIRKWLACPNGLYKTCTIQWGEESFDYAMMWAYANVDGSPIVNGTTLSDDYYITRLPIVRERLAVAALRLAATLTMTLTLLSPSSSVLLDAGGTGVKEEEDATSLELINNMMKNSNEDSMLLLADQ